MQLEGARAAIDLMRKRENVSAARAIVYARFLELGRSNQRGNAFVSLGMWGRSRKFVVEYGGSNFAFEYGGMAMPHYSRLCPSQ